MPLVNRTFDQLIDFTRTSAGTFVGSNGLIQTTPASKNILTFTQEFANAAWVKTSVTVTANTTTAPDATSTADTITATAAASTHAVYLSTNLAGATQWTASVYAKAGTHGLMQIMHSSNANFFANFNLTTGVVGTVGVGVTSTAITPVGDGWYRCSMTFTPAAPGTIRFQVISAATSAYNESWTPAGTETFFLWGAQAEIAAAPTAYTRNFGGTFPPRFEYNPATLLPLGLLVEEQRVNLLIYSEAFDNAAWTPSNVTVTANTSVSPDGATTADTFDDGVATGLHRVFRSSLTYTAAAQTVSVYAKAGTGAWFQFIIFDGTTSFYANFDVLTGTVGNKHASATSSIVPVGNGWYRCVMTATTASTAAGNFQIGMLVTDTASPTPSFTGANRTLFMWGVQHEVGAFPTSYIPTVASQVTRTADIALIQTPNFAPWYNQPQGTFFVEFTPDTTVATTNVRVLTVSQAAAAGRVVDIYPNVGIWTTFNGTTNLATGAATVTSTPQKFAAAFASGSYAACLNGGTVATAATATVNSPTQMTIGHFPSPTNFINGHIRSIRFYPTRLNDAQLQALTT